MPHWWRRVGSATVDAPDTDKVRVQGTSGSPRRSDTQVKERQVVLDVIDEKPVPAARNRGVKAFSRRCVPRLRCISRTRKILQNATAKLSR